MKEEKPSEALEKAVALQYQDGVESPKVLASGVGFVAQKIIELAQENNIPVHQDSLLADLLSKVAVGASIPDESSKILAEIICFLYEADKSFNLGIASIAELPSERSLLKDR